jgi:glycosyltransferase involved in cell wall biosynthesis
MNRTRPFVCCVVPCYNLGAVCGPVVRDAASRVDCLIAVDDGSSDDTAAVLNRIVAETAGHAHILRLPHNRGKGVALLTAFQFALATVPFDVLLTLDGDGQHRPEDIPRLTGAARRETSLVIGERSDSRIMPWRSRIGNQLTTSLLRRFYPQAPVDTQSGMRWHTREFVQEIVRRIRGRRYETELQILLLALEQRRRIESVPIPTIYFQNNRLSHFRPLLDSWRIWRALICWRLSAGKA